MNGKLCLSLKKPNFIIFGQKPSPRRNHQKVINKAVQKETKIALQKAAKLINSQKINLFQFFSKRLKEIS